MPSPSRTMSLSPISCWKGVGITDFLTPTINVASAELHSAIFVGIKLPVAMASNWPIPPNKTPRSRCRRLCGAQFIPRESDDVDYDRVSQ